MNRHLYIDCDGVIFDSIKYAFLEMEKLGVDLQDQVAIDNYFRDANWENLLSPDKIINDSIKKINELRDSWMFLGIHVLTHVSSFYEAVYKTELIEPQIEGVGVITIPRKIGKERIVNPFDNILVDDALYKVKDWINHGGIGVLFKQDVNRLIKPFEFQNDQNYFITNDLADLLEIQRILNSRRKVMSK